MTEPDSNAAQPETSPTGSSTAHSEVSGLQRVWLRHPRDAFQSQVRIDEEWQSLGYLTRPDLARAVAEYDEFVTLLEDSGTDIDFLPASNDLCLDSIYVRDSSIVTDHGMIFCNMGKQERSGEPAAQRAVAEASSFSVLGAIEDDGCLEGGDFVWLRPDVAAVGRGYRTNSEGIRQLSALLAGVDSELFVVPLPHWKGPSDVFHLMSIISPIADDLALVYSPLMPVPFRERLLDLGFALVEVPDEEFETMGANVLATGPRRALMVDGNPITRGRLEKAGVDVTVYAGNEISMKGCGGPTCLTRPLLRSASS